MRDSVFVEQHESESQLNWSKNKVEEQLGKNGQSLRSLRDKFNYLSGYRYCLFNSVFKKPFPKSEWIIANAIGVEPPIIWPSRYKNYDAKKYKFFKMKYGPGSSFFCP
ncbi:helix-turn-helix domain-containing protein [Xenorhabdus nematophila]|uniref:helix-turn-helix domain-containing protein n=1 Tax=Xenorhabdus nematophila TaxID=628 RepID=UPI0032B84349